ncbi:c-type cytochrome [Oceaniglobus roseus]|uniref:c-type cytochrome n=1 Tax=Oceaniglobus roseus TaxID=1737570 RepID=UPI001FEB5622|nr:c-type cytochrome [Kandeliimicrobium roseum]
MPEHLPFRTLGAAIAAATLILATGGARAEDAGRQEYMYNCSACHGESARGDGPVARYLNVSTPDLTALARKNDGVFPLLHVIQVIDGRSGVGPHGTPMPVWGERFMKDGVEDAGPYAAEVIVRGRILSLAEYLESIQKQE